MTRFEKIGLAIAMSCMLIGYGWHVERTGSFNIYSYQGHLLHHVPAGAVEVCDPRLDPDNTPATCHIEK